MKYKVPFNKHKYADNSDTPKRGTMTIEAESAEDAFEKAAAIRNVNETGIITPKGNRYYIGMIHQPYVAP